MKKNNNGTYSHQEDNMSQSHDDLLKNEQTTEV